MTPIYVDGTLYLLDSAGWLVWEAPGWIVAYYLGAIGLGLLYAIWRPRLAFFKVGGIWFGRVGRLFLSFGMSRA